MLNRTGSGLVLMGPCAMFSLVSGSAYSHFHLHGVVLDIVESPIRCLTFRQSTLLKEFLYMARVSFVLDTIAGVIPPLHCYQSCQVRGMVLV